MKKEMRTSRQIEAKALDAELGRMAGRLVQFAAEWGDGAMGFSIAHQARSVNDTRAMVRNYMHQDDIVGD